MVEKKKKIGWDILHWQKCIPEKTGALSLCLPDLVLCYTLKCQAWRRKWERERERDE